MNRAVKTARASHFCSAVLVALVVLFAGCGKFRGASADADSGPDPQHPHSVNLVWKPSTSKVIGYNIYRASPPGKPGTKLTPKPITDTQYTDNTVRGGNSYSYSVTSVDEKGVESRPTTEVLARVPRP